MTKVSDLKTIKETIYFTLKDEICNGQYFPGSQVQEQEIAGRFNSSRSPVREALKQLVADGLLEEFPNRGVFIRKYTEKDICDIFDLRIILEGYAIKKIDDNLTPGKIVALNTLLSDLRKHHEENDVNKYIINDASLHHQIVVMCKNNPVISTYEKLSDMMRQFRIYTFKDSDNFDKSLKDHEEIINYLLDDDPRNAYEVNRTHLLKARDIILEGVRNYYKDL